MALRDLVPWRRGEGHDNPIATLQREMNRMFDNLWADVPAWPRFGNEAGGFMPKVEVSEHNSNVEVSAELPGIAQKDIEVVLSPDASMLTIKGEKRFEKEHKDKAVYQAERAYGAFRRVIALPSAVQADRVEATFKDGVLHVRMPKAEAAATGAKKIAVK
jgi:HSP20 family protein